MSHLKNVFASLLGSLSPRIGAFFIGLFGTLIGFWMTVPIISSILSGVAITGSTDVVYTILSSVMVIVGIGSIISIFTENQKMRFELSKVHMFSWSFLFLYAVTTGSYDIGVPLYFVISTFAVWSYISEIHHLGEDIK